LSRRACRFRPTRRKYDVDLELDQISGIAGRATHLVFDDEALSLDVTKVAHALLKRLLKGQRHGRRAKNADPPHLAPQAATPLPPRREA